MLDQCRRWLTGLGASGLLLAASAGVAAETPNLELTVPRVAAAPTVDGRLDDATWLEASAKGGKVVVDISHEGTSLSEYPRVAYVAYDDQALYVAFVIFAPDVSKLVGDRADWWENDEVEIFVEPGKRGSYTQIGITSAGTVSVDGVQAVVQKSGIRWTVEAAIPWSAVGSQAPKAGDRWGLNLNGHQIATGDLWVAWNPTYGGFHNASRFATVIFGQ